MSFEMSIADHVTGSFLSDLSLNPRRSEGRPGQQAVWTAHRIPHHLQGGERFCEQRQSQEAPGSLPARLDWHGEELCQSPDCK